METKRRLSTRHELGKTFVNKFELQVDFDEYGAVCATSLVPHLGPYVASILVAWCDTGRIISAISRGAS